MDALPIAEATGLPHASTVPGAMHACGHDGHTAMLLGAAQYLAETRNFDGTAVVVFQPAEEGGGGGREMVDDGMMERFGIEEVYGMHNMPGKPVGDFVIRPGAMLAASDTITITVTGRGGHAAEPHNTVDPVVVGSAIVLALQSIVARTIDPLHPAVVSITSFRTDSDTFNVIPGSVELRGTVRTLDTAMQDAIEARMRTIVEATAAAHGATAELQLRAQLPGRRSTPRRRPTSPPASPPSRRQRPAIDREAPPVMGAEDFSFMLKARPGAFIFVGNGDSAKLHHPKYEFNDELIPIGCSYWARLVETAMPAA